MKNHPKSILFLAFALLSPLAAEVRAQSSATAAMAPELIAAVTAADDERMAASVAADRARLDEILSDELRYAHSNGRIDSKASLMESLVSGRMVYEGFDYKERSFVKAGEGVMLMRGRVIMNVRNGDQKLAIDLNFLGVWRQENGKWRFLAWQSCRNPAAAPATKK